MLLSISMVTWAQEEDLEDEEEAQVEDGDVDMETDSGESIEVDANVSFQVRYHTTKSENMHVIMDNAHLRKCV